MAVAPYKINDRRSSSGYSNNTLIEAATQTTDRKNIPLQDYDFHRNISSLGRRTLLTLGRRMFWNIPALHGGLLEQANLAVGTFIPQFWGANQAWGDLAELWLENWHRIFDIAGWPYDYNTYLQSLILCPLVDGDIGTVLTETPDGYPMIQTIPAHRIRSNASEATVVGGEWDGARIVDGVIVNDYGRPLAYRVYDDGAIASNYRDISARDMFLTFIPLFPGQVRGISILASSAFDWQDVKESRDWEKIAQKTFSSRTIVEENETGELDPAKAIVSTAGTFNDDGTRATAEQVKLDGGTYTIFKAGTNSKLTPFDWNRPSQNSQQFQETLIRDAFRGTEWDSFFSLDPKSVGGAPMRVIVEKINAVIKKRRRMAERPCARVDGYGIAKAIKLGLLPEEPDWWKWEHQGPGDVTADRKYDSDVDLQELEAGFATLKKSAARRGDYWQDLRRQQDIEVDDLLQRAEKRAKQYNIPMEQAIALYRRIGNFSTSVSAAPEAQPESKPKENE